MGAMHFNFFGDEMMECTTKSSSASCKGLCTHSLLLPYLYDMRSRPQMRYLK